MKTSKITRLCAIFVAVMMLFALGVPTFANTAVGNEARMFADIVGDVAPIGGTVTFRVFVDVGAVAAGQGANAGTVVLTYDPAVLTRAAGSAVAGTGSAGLDIPFPPGPTSDGTVTIAIENSDLTERNLGRFHLVSVVFNVAANATAGTTTPVTVRASAIAGLTPSGPPALINFPEANRSFTANIPVDVGVVDPTGLRPVAGAPTVLNVNSSADFAVELYPAGADLGDYTVTWTATGAVSASGTGLSTRATAGAVAGDGTVVATLTNAAGAEIDTEVFNVTVQDTPRIAPTIGTEIGRWGVREVVVGFTNDTGAVLDNAYVVVTAGGPGLMPVQMVISGLNAGIGEVVTFNTGVVAQVGQHINTFIMADLPDPIPAGQTFADYVAVNNIGTTPTAHIVVAN